MGKNSVPSWAALRSHNRFPNSGAEYSLQHLFESPYALQMADYTLLEIENLPLLI